MQIEKIVDCIRNNRIKITDHADEEAHSDSLTYDEIFNSVLQGEIIEEYNKDKPYPSFLICGNNSKIEPIHSVWAYSFENKWAVLITVYRPDSNRWIDCKIRRKQ